MAKTKSTEAHKAKKSLLGIFMNLILWIFSLSCIFPIVWMIYSSLKEKRRYLTQTLSDFQRARHSSTIREF